MRVDFYQLGGDPVETAIPLLARRAAESGARMLVVSDDADQRQRISTGLWAASADSFLANGEAGGPDDALQMILMSESLDAPNTARFLFLADGRWREGADGFERVFLLFDAVTVEGARATWRSLDGREGLERNFWKQEDGRWTKAA